MNGKVLLDTNIVAALFKDDPAVHERLGQHLRVLVSAIVLGESYFGAQRSTRLDKHETNQQISYASRSARK